jgi:hypothetical protein
MESNLINWLELACSEVLQCENVSSLSLEECVVFVGKNLFGIDGDLDTNGVHDHISDKIGVYYNPQLVTNTVKLILKYVVSPECPEREQFVSHIISMSSSMQECLMKTIQEESTDSPPIPPKKEARLAVEQPERLQTDFPCDMCFRKDRELEKYSRDLSDAINRESALEEKLQVENSANLRQVLDLECIINEKDIAIKRMKADIAALQKTESELLTSVKEKSTLVNKISTLEDRIDILEPLANRAETASNQLERLKEKMDRLTGVQEQLRAESESHNETHARLLEAQQELDTLRTSKSHLEDYRTRCAENQITIADLTSRLAFSESSAQALAAELDAVREGSHNSEKMAKRLNDELKNASEELKSFNRVTGIGDSMSELNPEVMKELRFLRTENEDLKSKLDMSSLESLDKMQQDISDQKCVNTSLQQKWTLAKDTIKERNAQIVDLEDSLRDWKHKYSVLFTEHREACAMAAEDTLSQRILFASKVKHLKTRSEHQAKLARMGSETVVHWLSEDLHVTSETLKFTESELKCTTEARDELDQQLKETEHKLQETDAKVISTIEENKRKVDELTHSYEEELQAVVEKGKRKIAEIQEEHTSALDIESRKANSLAADVEEEKLKRRRVDRERRFYESEMQKYKSQLQVASASGGGSSLEVEGAIKEMKVMQAQLDASQIEAKRLREQIALLENAPRDSQSVGSQHRNSLSDRALHIDSNTEVENKTQLLSSRPQRVRVATSHEKASTVSHSTASKKDDNISAYVEQTELLERRIEQMTRERREMISKNLEENKEKMEMSQKLLQSEREFATLKAKMTKITLEKERLERRIAKGEMENVPPKPTSTVGSSLVL